MLRREAETSGLYVFNFDGPGVEGKLYLVGGDERRDGVHPHRLGSLVRESCRELGLPLGRLLTLGALFDHIPFAQRGLDAVSLVAIGKATWSIHTTGDAVDKLAASGFRNAGEVALRVIEKLADRD